MATIADLPAQYKPCIRALNKAGQRIIDIIADPNPDGMKKALAIAGVHGVMQEAVTQIQQMIKVNATDIETTMDAEIAKPIA